MLQAVQELYEAEPVDPWPPNCPRTCKFVFIGECRGKGRGGMGDVLIDNETMWMYGWEWTMG